MLWRNATRSTNVSPRRARASVARVAWTSARCASRAVALVLAPLALGACAPPAPAGDPACRRACEADAMESARRVCGTDRRTWTACEWLCGAVPAGVSVWPGACGSDGAPPAERPASPADGQSVCDWARVGGSWIAVECTDGVRGVTEVGTAPMGGMPFEHRSPADLPAEVDHRARFGPVRTQGQTNACTAFTTVAALEGALAVQGASATLSEMHLWARYHTPSSDAAIVAARHGGIASAQAAAAAGFAFDDARARAWTTDAAHPTATERPDPAVLAQLDAAGEFQVTAVNVIDPPAGREVPTADQLRAALADGLDVAAAFSTGDPWARAGADGVIADYGYSGRGAHAVLLVGYRAIGGQTYFIVRNSWGPAWGDAGYGYLPAHAAEANLLQAWVVSVRNAATARTAPRCAEGEAAGLDRVCRRVCPDGAFADASGACPGATGAACPSGGVRDASGVCVDACAAGDDAGDGFAVHCAQHGCTWTIDDGAFGCSGGPCVAYCPAPACQLVVDTDVATGEPSWSCAAPEP